MIFECKDYRTFLKTTLVEKSQNREGYSLRAFADKISVSNSFLSEVLNSKKSLSVELAFKIALKLDLTDLESQYFCLLVQLEQEKDQAFREEILKRLTSLNPKRKTYDLSLDLFKAISEWYHTAILELTFLTGFKMNALNISKKIDITKVEAEMALDRLLRLEMLELDKNGNYKRAHDYMLTQSTIPNNAFKEYHKKLLEKATSSLYTQTPQERVSASDVLAMDSKYIKEVDRLSQEFSAAVLKLGDKSKVKDSVYALSVHCFKLTENKGKFHE